MHARTHIRTFKHTRAFILTYTILKALAVMHRPLALPKVVEVEPMTDDSKDTDIELDQQSVSSEVQEKRVNRFSLTPK